MKILRTDALLETPHVDAELRRMGHDLTLLPDGATEEAVCEAIHDADLLLMCYQPITARVIDAAPNLKGIVKYGVGIDAIDIPTAKARDIKVVNIPEYAEDTVAEGAFALMISLAKRLPALQRTMQDDGWAWPEAQHLGRDIAGSTVGLIGLGKIGSSMARMAGLGFRARVLAYSPHTPQERFDVLGVTRCTDLHDMLGQCDFVSVHSVLNPETHHLIGEAELRAMQPHASLINVSRGAIVDEQALIRALDAGWIAGAGLDVFSDEPLALRDHPLSALFGRDNVMLSPHLTFYTHEAMGRLEQETLQRCRELLDGRELVIKSADPRLAGQGKGVRYVTG